MAYYLVVNATTSQLTNINVGGIDVPALSVRTATLTDTELGTLASTAGVAVLKSDATYQIKRNVRRVLKYKSATGAAL